MGPRQEHSGIFLTVEGIDPQATAAWARVLAEALRRRRLVVTETAEPAKAAGLGRVPDVLHALHVADQDVEPETAALLSAADRAEHVAHLIRPALDRGEVVICERYVLTSLAVHGGGRGADVDRIRQVNGWSTGDLSPDLVLIVATAPGLDELQHGFEELDADLLLAVLGEAADSDPHRCFTCPPEVPETLPPVVTERLQRLIDARASALATAEPVE
jgi:dTMP kinase